MVTSVAPWESWFIGLHSKATFKTCYLVMKYLQNGAAEDHQSTEWCSGRCIMFPDTSAEQTIVCLSSTILHEIAWCLILIEYKTCLVNDKIPQAIIMLIHFNPHHFVLI